MSITPRTIIFIALFHLSIGIGLIAGSLCGSWNIGLYDQLIRAGRLANHVAVESKGMDEHGRIVLVPYDYNPAPTIPLIRMDGEAASEAFATVPPEPMDWAVLFHQLQTYRVRNLDISAPLVWKNTSNKLVSMALASHLGNFAHVTVGKPVMLSARGTDMPKPWQKLALEASQYAGDTSSLPPANKLYGEDSMTLRGSVTAPSQVEQDELFAETANQTSSQPLFIRWNDRILPSSSLISALVPLGLDKTDIHVHFGEKLRLGDKISLPIDMLGRIPLRPDAEPYILTPAEIIVLPDNVALSARQKEISPILETAPVCMICEPFDNTPSVSPISMLSAKTISSLLAGIGPGTPVCYEGLSSLLFWVLIIDLAVISLWSLRFSGWTRRGLLGACLALVIGGALYFFYSEEIWLPFITLFFTWLTVCVTAFFISPSASPDDDLMEEHPQPAGISIETFDFNEPNEIPIPRRQKETPSQKP